MEMKLVWISTMEMDILHGFDELYWPGYLVRKGSGEYL